MLKPVKKNAATEEFDQETAAFYPVDSKIDIRPNALGERLESYRPWCKVVVRQAIFGQVGQRVDDSDVVQATWLDAVRKLDQFKGETEAEFFAWLKTILDNNIKNLIRDNLAGKRDVRRESPPTMVGQMDSATVHWYEVASQGSTPSSLTIKGENALALANALEQLPENQRLAIELRYLQGLKLSQVSSQMDKTPDAIVGLIRRGIESLKQSLASSSASSIF